MLASIFFPPWKLGFVYLLLKARTITRMHSQLNTGFGKKQPSRTLLLAMCGLSSIQVAVIVDSHRVQGRKEVQEETSLKSHG